MSEPVDDCSKLAQSTTLNSPNEGVVKKLKKGDLLDIILRTVGKVTIVEASYKGQTAGTITSSVIQKLAECIAKGNEYVAEVKEDVKGGACKVLVRPK